jgi:hypothetical protein
VTGKRPIWNRKRVPALTRRTAGAGLAVVLVALATGCGPIVEQAAFSYRPDTMTPGDLLGPFDGMVVDAETDRPIGGAVVAGSWAFERGVGLTGPAGAYEVVTETGADGRYRLPGLEQLPSGPSMRVRRFTLIVYQRGYVGWRSDGKFPEGILRRDFSQRGNRVRLEKWREGLVHHRHLMFLGGGAAIRTAAQAEVQAAVMELEGKQPIEVAGAAAGTEAAGPKRPLDASVLLSEDELRGVTGYPGVFELGKLKDLPTTEFYDSLHFKARGQPETSDVGLRLWRLGAAGAEAQYNKLLGQLPGATRADEVGDASLRARTPAVLGIAFLSRDRGTVVSLSCGVKQCTEPAMMLRLAKLIESHLGELAGAAEGSPAPAPGGGPAGRPQERTP